MIFAKTNRSRFFFLFISMLVSVQIQGDTGYQLSTFKHNSSYFISDVDINKDGVLDKVVSHKANEGNSLLFFQKTNNGFKLVLEGENLSVDGGNIIGKFFPINDKTNNVMYIHTYFPDRGHFISNHYISYNGKDWIVSKTKYEIKHWQNDYTKTYICEVYQDDIRLTDKNIIAKLLPPPEERDLVKECQIEYYTEKNLSEFIERFKEDETIIKGVDRYADLLKKFPLTTKTLTTYNSIIHHLQGSGANKEALFLLEKMKKKGLEKDIPIKALKKSSKQIKQKEAKVFAVKIKNSSKQIVIFSRRTFLYKYPEDNKKTKMYLIKGDKVTLLDEKTDNSGQKWYFINYKGKKDLNMWIKAEAVDVEPVKEPTKKSEPETKQSTPKEPVEITKQTPVTTPPKNAEVIKVEKAEPIEQSASGSISLTFLTSFLGLLAWRVS